MAAAYFNEAEIRLITCSEQPLVKSKMQACKQFTVAKPHVQPQQSTGTH
jgi:hypothetical protein